jgi:hypothetical protein
MASHPAGLGYGEYGRTIPSEILDRIIIAFVFLVETPSDGIITRILGGLD